MYLKNILFLSILSLAILSCDEKKDTKEVIAEQERIAFEKTADSLAAVTEKIDSLNLGIQQTSNDIEALLDEINEQ